MNDAKQQALQAGRAATGVACHCGGHDDCDDCVDCTPKELENYNCGRTYECCARAFVCRLCGSRLVGKAESPEMEDF